MVGGIVGLVLSGNIVKSQNISPGDATLIDFVGIWRTWFALYGAMAADVEDNNFILGNTMMGGNMGLLAMAILSPRRY